MEFEKDSGFTFNLVHFLDTIRSKQSEKKCSSSHHLHLLAVSACRAQPQDSRVRAVQLELADRLGVAHQIAHDVQCPAQNPGLAAVGSQTVGKGDS